MMPVAHCAAGLSHLPASPMGTRQPFTPFFRGKELGTTVEQLLVWLWDTVAEPVLDLLLPDGPAAGDPLPRLWWSPGSLLGFLPLHASGRHTRTATVLDRTISSYTPAVRALRHARAARGLVSGDRRVLAVAMPETFARIGPWPVPHHVLAIRPQQAVLPVHEQAAMSGWTRPRQRNSRKPPSTADRRPPRAWANERQATASRVHVYDHRAAGDHVVRQGDEDGVALAVRQHVVEHAATCDHREGRVPPAPGRCAPRPWWAKAPVWA